MKIAVAGTRGIPHIQGGVETHCEQLYPRLAGMGCDITLFRRSCYVVDELNMYGGVQLKDIYTPKRKSFEAIFHTFLAVVKARKMDVDIIHIHSIGPSLLIPFAKLLGLKVVMTHHGPDYDRRKWNRMAKFFLRLGERMAVQSADEIIVISKVIDQLIREKYNRQDAHLIHNGVNIPGKASSTAYIERLGLKKGGYVLAVGRFVSEKGFDLLIDSIPLLKEQNIRLVLAGDADHKTEYASALKKKAKERGVILTGFISGNELAEVFSHARLFVLPSYHEGLPISLLEAMSYGLDILVSDIPANKEVNLSPSSYFSVGNSDDLQQKMSAKLSRPYSNYEYEMGAYDWNKIALQVLDVYKKINFSADSFCM